MPKRLDDRLELLGPDEIRRWRENVPPGHTRHAYTFRGPGGRDDPDELIPRLSPDEGYVDGDSATLSLDPLPGGIEDARKATETFVGMMLEWARSPVHAKHRLERAKVLKATSPLQFSHISEEDLADQLADIAIEKAKEAVARTYRMNGWDKGVDLGRTTSPANATPVLLPGQRGRG